MESEIYWRLCDELSISQAAHLIIGSLPGEVEAMEYSGAELTPASRVRYMTNLQATCSALVNAMKGGRLQGNLVQANDRHEEQEVFGGVHIGLSTLLVSDLKKWLASRGIKTGFFFPEGSELPDYLDKSHPRYAPKLAASVSAWLAVDDPVGKSPKQALEKWLREHAAEFGMTDDDGRPIALAIEECSKVANWKPGGGAAKTPG